MTYLEAAIKEASRLCPVASGLLRESEEDVTVDNIKFRKGTSILINTYAYNRSEDVFGPTANEFRPERWAEKNTPTTLSFGIKMTKYHQILNLQLQTRLWIT
eukprot:TRINITY_DN369_c0_g1_i11.p1 TRINITY_DN369_c0_g1~~TRINITY_DN369_c0_g1_i11.p1  ORF type:complete len:102 (-),score=8.50 TRINITY_DN369_c0_g1_i11:101-406(-)